MGRLLGVLVTAGRDDSSTGEHPARALGRRLDIARRQRGWSYREFERRTGKSKSTLQYLIRTRTSALEFFELKDLVEALGEQWSDEWHQLLRAVDALPSEVGSDGPPEAAIDADPVALTRAVPAQLPTDVSAFFGRDAELTELDHFRALSDQSSGDRSTAVVISALSGTAGVGKTALAVRWAHRVRDAFPDGQLYVNLRGYDPGEPMSADDALAAFLYALGVAGNDIPLGVDDRAALFRTMLDGRRTLVVLDNAASAEQVRPLIPGTRSCFVVVTSRDSLAGLVARDGAHRIRLNPLAPTDADVLLHTLIGARAAAEPGAAAALAEQCDRLPLALRVAAEVAAARLGTSLAQLVCELADERRRLDLLDASGDPRTAIRGVLSWSYRHLSAGAARAFRLLGRHPGPTFSVHAAAALLDAELDQVQSLLDQLSRAHLVRLSERGRYGMHDLLRAYATELADTIESEPALLGHTQRVLDYYLYTAHAANLLLEPHRHPIALPPAGPAAKPDEFTDAAEAVAWFTTEHSVLMAAIRWAARAGFDIHTWQLAWTLTTFFERRGHWQDWIDTQHGALGAARRLADRSGQACVHRCLARAYEWLGRHDDSHGHLLQALDLFREVGDRDGQARTHLNLSTVVERQGRHREALEHDQQALDLFAAAGDRYGQALALNQLGCDNILFGDYQQALAHCEDALALLREIGDESGQAAAWDSLGAAYHGLRRYAQAITCYRRAIALYRQLGNRCYEADTLIHLGETHNVAGDTDSARHVWKYAVDLLDDVGHARADEVRARLQLLET